jgi:hypothetical protein
LTGKAISKLVFGRTIAVFSFFTGLQWWVYRTKDGKATQRSPKASYNGRSWIEDEMLCNQYEKLHEGLKECSDVYHNMEGAPEMKKEYLIVGDLGLHLFSPVD